MLQLIFFSFHCQFVLNQKKNSQNRKTEKMEIIYFLLELCGLRYLLRYLSIIVLHTRKRNSQFTECLRRP